MLVSFECIVVRDSLDALTIHTQASQSMRRHWHSLCWMHCMQGGHSRGGKLVFMCFKGSCCIADLISLSEFDWLVCLDKGSVVTLL